MKKFSILIIDDEEQGRLAVQNIIEKSVDFLTIIGTADSKVDAIEKIQRLNPDIITLDINLGDGTGFEVLNALSDPPKTIFVTAYDEFALKAFKFNAIDYILKPFEREELIQAMDKVIPYLSFENANSPEKELVNFEATKIDKIVIQSQSGFDVVALKDILFIKADNNYSVIHLNNGQKKMISKTLKHFEEMLLNLGFFRCHQSYLVKISSIKSFSQEDNSLLTLVSGEKIDVSRRKKEELNKLFKK